MKVTRFKGEHTTQKRELSKNSTTFHDEGYPRHFASYATSEAVAISHCAQLHNYVIAFNARLCIHLACEPGHLRPFLFKFQVLQPTFGEFSMQGSPKGLDEV